MIEKHKQKFQILSHVLINNVYSYSSGQFRFHFRIRMQPICKPEISTDQNWTVPNIISDVIFIPAISRTFLILFINLIFINFIFFVHWSNWSFTIRCLVSISISLLTSTARSIRFPFLILKKPMKNINFV